MPRRCAEQVREPSVTGLPSPIPQDPLPTVAAWLAEMTAGGKRRNPNALALATADASGSPSVRMVLVKEIAESGYLVFYTNYGSRKAGELDRAGRAAGVLYWEELGKQVRFEGPVLRSPAAESDAYFASRPERSQLNAWASRQSEPLLDAAELERRAEQKARELRGGPIARPRSWGGYRLWFDALELWAEGADRFHERLRYTRELVPADAFSFRAGPWSWQRLQP
jgi:pyridoxamine 5'-phosphate oxidase